MSYLILKKKKDKEIFIEFLVFLLLNRKGEIRNYLTKKINAVNPTVQSSPDLRCLQDSNWLIHCQFICKKPPPVYCIFSVSKLGRLL